MDIDVGTLTAASVLEFDHGAVIVIKGSDGTARVDIPEDMAVPFRDTAREVVRVYDEDAVAPGDGEVLIGDGGTVVIETPEEFLEWSHDIRGPECLVVEDDTERPTELVVWSEQRLDIPEGVEVWNVSIAMGKAPAIRDREVEGWLKYVLRLAGEFDDPLEGLHIGAEGGA